MANKGLQGKEQFYSKNYLLEIPCFHAKMRLKVTHKNGTLQFGKSYFKKLYTGL